MSLLTARCLGSCGLAPAVVFDERGGRQGQHRQRCCERLEKWTSRMTPEELEQIAESEREAQEQLQAPRPRLHRGRLPLLPEPSGQGRAGKGSRRPRHCKDQCQVKGVGCMGLCAAGPLVATSAGVLYQNVDGRRRAGDHRQPRTASRSSRLDCPTDVPFFQRQKKIVLENSGSIDPERIEDYIAADGYVALVKALTEMTPREVIERGHAAAACAGAAARAIPPGLKWSTVAKAGGRRRSTSSATPTKAIPGAFMDRSVLESDPHRVLEGMADRRPMPSARRRATSTCAPSIRWRSSA